MISGIISEWPLVYSLEHPRTTLQWAAKCIYLHEAAGAVLENLQRGKNEKELNLKE